MACGGKGVKGESRGRNKHCELSSSPPSPLTHNHCSSIYSLVSAALGSQIKVADRPVTQQGLGGMKTGARGRNNSRSQTTGFSSRGESLRPLVLVLVGRA